MTASEEVLPGPQIIHRGVNGGMAQKQLDLLEYAARVTAQAGAGAAKIMRSEVPETEIAGHIA